MTIKSFEEFNKDNTTPIEEGLLNAIKVRKEIIQLQCAVCDEYEKLLKKNPEKYKNGSSVLKEVEDFAKKAYDKIVKTEGALSFEDWWKGFSQSNARMLEKTVFLKEGVDNYSGEYTIEITYSKADDEEKLGEMGHAELYTNMLTSAGLDVEFKQKRFTIEATVTYNNKEEFDVVVRFAAFDLGYTDTVLPKLSRKTYDEVSEIVLQNSKPKLFR
jgi:hypothetical protein